MSKSQKIVIALTGLAATVQCLVPPWKLRKWVDGYGVVNSKLGHCWLASPPGPSNVTGVDWQVLVLQLAITVIIGATLFLLLKKSGNYHSPK